MTHVSLNSTNHSAEERLAGLARSAIALKTHVVNTHALEEDLGERVLAARSSGVSWDLIAAALAGTPQATQERFDPDTNRVG